MTAMRLAFCGLFLSGAAAVGAEPARSIRLPAAPVLPQPMPPAPDPGAVVRLAGDSLYVVAAGGGLLRFARA